jgi:hypothetical protein
MKRAPRIVDVVHIKAAMNDGEEFDHDGGSETRIATIFHRLYSLKLTLRSAFTLTRFAIWIDLRYLPSPL